MTNTKKPKDYLKKAGDCELRNIDFRGSEVRLLVYDPYYEKSLAILLNNVHVFVMATNHVQNVISSLNFANSLSEIDSGLYYFQEMKDVVFNMRNIKLKEDSPTLYVEPSAGPWLISQFEEIVLKFVTENSHP